MATDIEHSIRCNSMMVLRDEPAIDVLAASERCAVALVLDRCDLLPRGFTILDAIEQLGQEWTDAAVRVQRCGIVQCEEHAHG